MGSSLRSRAELPDRWDRVAAVAGQVGLVVHPRRDVDAALDVVRAWTLERGITVGQVRIPGQSRSIAEPVEAESCDFVIALGGDGTALAATHAAAAAARPVLGVACGSIGVLTSVDAHRLRAALDRVGAGDWTEKSLPGLRIAVAGSRTAVAINDVAVVRNGTGQVIAEVRVDGELYARMAGDGLIVATPLGSSAYTLAAGGPLVLPEAHAMVLTPLARHGGVSPPLVIGSESQVALSVESGYGGSRFEVDGQLLDAQGAEATVALSRDYATMIAFEDQESMLSGLRRRGLVTDSPRVLIRDKRAAPEDALG
jgi:NAD+ kinase